MVGMTGERDACQVNAKLTILVCLLTWEPLKQRSPGYFSSYLKFLYGKDHGKVDKSLSFCYMFHWKSFENWRKKPIYNRLKLFLIKVGKVETGGKVGSQKAGKFQMVVLLRSFLLRY